METAMKVVAVMVRVGMNAGCVEPPDPPPFPSIPHPSPLSMFSSPAATSNPATPVRPPTSTTDP